MLYIYIYVYISYSEEEILRIPNGEAVEGNGVEGDETVEVEIGGAGVCL